MTKKVYPVVIAKNRILIKCSYMNMMMDSGLIIRRVEFSEDISLKKFKRMYNAGNSNIAKILKCTFQCLSKLIFIGMMSIIAEKMEPQQKSGNVCWMPCC